jgi:hypothetical protein
MVLFTIEAGPDPSKGFGRIEVRFELRSKLTIHLDKMGFGRVSSKLLWPKVVSLAVDDKSPMHSSMAH